MLLIARLEDNSACLRVFLADACCPSTVVIIEILKLLSFVNPGSRWGRAGGAAPEFSFEKRAFKNDARSPKITTVESVFSGEGRGGTKNETLSRKPEVSTRKSRAATLTLFLGRQRQRRARRRSSLAADAGATTRACFFATRSLARVSFAWIHSAERRLPNPLPVYCSRRYT